MLSSSEMVLAVAHLGEYPLEHPSPRRSKCDFGTDVPGADAVNGLAMHTA